VSNPSYFHPLPPPPWGGGGGGGEHLIPGGFLLLFLVKKVEARGNDGTKFRRSLIVWLSDVYVFSMIKKITHLYSL